MCIQNVMIMSFCTIMNPTDELIFLMHGENWCRSRLHGVVRCVKKLPIFVSPGFCKFHPLATRINYEQPNWVWVGIIQYVCPLILESMFH